MKTILQSFTVALLCFANLFLSLFGLPLFPTTDLDRSRFTDEPVFAEEFDGDTLDKTVWNGHIVQSGTMMRKGGYWNEKMASVEDGALHIRTAYCADGLDGGPAGWYSYAVDTNGRYAQKYGYFECRCILPEGVGLWSAFWMLCNSMGDTTLGGVNGAEIDVMESPFYHDKILRNTTVHTIHIDGYGDAHKRKGSGNYRIDGDPYTQFHTYGVEWNEDEYIFYIDGKRTARTDFGGASQVEEYMLLSVEVGGENGVPAESWAGASIDENGRDFTTDFVVDYVRAYAYK